MARHRRRNCLRGIPGAVFVLVPVVIVSTFAPELISTVYSLLLRGPHVAHYNQNDMFLPVEGDMEALPSTNGALVSPSEECLQTLAAHAAGAHGRNLQRRALVGGRRWGATPAQNAHYDHLVPTTTCAVQLRLEATAGLDATAAHVSATSSVPAPQPSVCLLPLAPWRLFGLSLSSGQGGKSKGSFIGWDPPPIVLGVANDDQQSFQNSSVQLLRSKPLLLDPKKFTELFSSHGSAVAGLELALGSPRVDILRIASCGECENALLDALEPAGPNSQPPIGQIILEGGPSHIDVVRTSIRLEKLGYALFHSEKEQFLVDGGSPRYSLSYMYSGPRSSSDLPQLQSDCVNMVGILASVASKHLTPNATQNDGQAPGGSQEAGGVQQIPQIPLYLLRPAYPCFVKERFGHWDEGGAWLCIDNLQRKPGRPSPTLVTVAGHANFAGSPLIGFEQQLAVELDVIAHVFNPSLEQAWDAEIHSVAFHNLWVAPRRLLTDSEGRHAVSLEEAVSVVHTRSVDVLRVDCEGCEYGLVEDIARLEKEGVVLFEQISMQVHLVDAELATDMFRRLLSVGYRLFHAEQDAYDARIIELSFARMES